MRFVVRMNTSPKNSCSWCEDNCQAKYRIFDNVTKWTDYACEEHLREHHKPEDLDMRVQYKNMPSLV